MSDKPVVLWVDEESCDWPVVASAVRNCGAELVAALDTQEGLELAQRDPAVVVLDCIVRRGPHSELPADGFAGLRLFEKLSPRQRSRTIFLTVVPFEMVQGDLAECNVPPERYFSKAEFDVAGFRRAVKAVLSGDAK